MGTIKPKPKPWTKLNANISVMVEVTKICKRQPIKYRDPPIKPTVLKPKRLNREPESRPAQLNEQKKALVIKPMALVSAPIDFRKSPNTKPNEGKAAKPLIWKYLVQLESFVL